MQVGQPGPGHDKRLEIAFGQGFLLIARPVQLGREPFPQPGQGGQGRRGRRQVGQEAQGKLHDRVRLGRLRGLGEGGGQAAEQGQEKGAPGRGPVQAGLAAAHGQIQGRLWREALGQGQGHVLGSRMLGPKPDHEGADVVPVKGHGQALAVRQNHRGRVHGCGQDFGQLLGCGRIQPGGGQGRLQAGRHGRARKKEQFPERSHGRIVAMGQECGQSGRVRIAVSGGDVMGHGRVLGQPRSQDIGHGSGQGLDGKGIHAVSYAGRPALSRRQWPGFGAWGRRVAGDRCFLVGNRGRLGYHGRHGARAVFMTVSYRGVRRTFGRVILAALLAFFSLTLWSRDRALAAALDLTDEEKAFVAQHPVVSFSDTDWRPLSIYENGRLQGLFHDYYGLISQKTGLAFRFVPIGDVRDFQLVLDALRERRIDMIDGTGKTADRAQYALFSGPFLRFPLAIACRDESAAFSLATLAGKRVAVARGGTAEEYLREHAPGLDLVEVEDPVAALILVATGKADAMVENMAVVAYSMRRAGLVNVKISGTLDYAFEIYSLIRSDWPLLASILQKAHQAVTEEEKAALLDKWLPVYKDRVEAGEAASGSKQDRPLAQGAAITLTDRERGYLESKKALAYCVDPDWPPIERIDENGRHVGMTADFLEIMGKRLGVQMVLVPTASWSQSLEAVKRRRCDFLAAAGDTRDRRRFLDFTTPYLHFPMVVATRSEEGFIDDPAKLVGKTLGVVNGYSSLDILRAKYPGIRLMEVASVAEGLRLVAEGKLQGYIDTVPAISQAIAKEHFSDLKIAGRLDAHLDLSVASRNDEPELRSLFQKAVDSLGKAESEAIVKKWVAVTFEQGFDYALLWKALAGAALVLAIVVWWNRKLARLNRTIRQAHEELDRTNRNMAALLDNAGQGFLSVGRDGLVEPGYSRECRVIFGQEILSAGIAALLYPDDAAGREAMAVNIRRIIDEPDAYRRDLYVSLMPRRIRRGEATLRLAYRPLSGNRLMFVVTDVSGEVRLKDAVAREHNRLACVVAVVREQRDFFAVLDDFTEFRRSGRAMIEEAATGRSALDVVYRRVHTLKGLFLQLECSHVAKALGDIEGHLSELRREAEPDRAAVAALLAEPAVDEALARDLDVVRQALGPEFFERRGEVCLGGALADALAALAGRLLSRAGELGLDPAETTMLESARTLRHVDIKKLLAAYPRTAIRQAEAQGKAVRPFAVTGDRILVDPVRFAPLAKSLVHLFRNAVDHGLETPEERQAAGKAPEGYIGCRVSGENGFLRIVVDDDGRGVDTTLVRARAYELGLGGAEELSALDETAALLLLLRDGFTSRREAGELSGRGVGLAAVLAEATRLGGGVDIENAPGQGTRIVVTVPHGRPEPSAGNTEST